MTVPAHRIAVCVVILIAALVFTGYPAPAGADPDKPGRVKAAIPGRTPESVADDLQKVIVLCADGQTCEPASTGSNPPAQATPKRSRRHVYQHNQTDQDFIRQRAK